MTDDEIRNIAENVVIPDEIVKIINDGKFEAFQSRVNFKNYNFKIDKFGFSIKPDDYKKYHCAIIKMLKADGYTEIFMHDPVDLCHYTCTR